MKKSNLENVFRCSLILALSGLLGCSAATQSSGTNFTCEPMSSPAAVGPTASNQAPLIAGCGYFNEPCVTVTICTPGTALGSATCQTIPNILLDTGSVGLRLFTCAVTVPLTTETDVLGNDIADYVGYLDGSCDWGPVKTADVYIGSSEKAGSVPIQIIDSKFVSVPTSSQTGNSCTSPDYSPLVAGFNGILGVGLAQTDCFLGDPSLCQSNISNGSYYSCTTSSCSNASVAVAKQVTNPVTLMNHNNNGVILSFPNVLSNTGATTLQGTLTLGIGTATGSDASNSLGALNVYKTDSNNDFQTNNFPGFDNQAYAPDDGLGDGVYGFIDSGSNTLAFPVGTTNAGFISSLPVCSDFSQTPGFYCPTTVVSVTGVTQASYLSAPSSAAISFNVANATNLLSSSNPNLVFNDIASSTGTTTLFDWGFPFFIGRTVFVHITGETAAGGTTAPFWAWSQP